MLLPYEYILTLSSFFYLLRLASSSANAPTSGLSLFYSDI